MLNYVKFLFVLSLFFNAKNIYAQDVEVFINLGKTIFEFREKIFAKIQIINNSKNEIYVEDWCGFDAPYVDFTLENNHNDKFHYWGRNIDCFRTNTFYFIETDTDIEFPLRLFYRLDFGPLLPIGEYILSGSVVIGKQKYFAERVKFEITSPVYEKAELIYNNAAKLKYAADETALKLYQEIFDNYPKSIISIAAMNDILFIIGTYERYLNNYRAILDTLQNQMLEHFVNYFPENRYAFITVIRTITLYRGKDRELMLKNRIPKYQNFLKLITNQDLKTYMINNIKKLQGKLNYLSNLRIEKIN